MFLKSLARSIVVVLGLFFIVGIIVSIYTTRLSVQEKESPETTQNNNTENPPQLIPSPNN